jgi:hypothetical protein
MSLANSIAEPPFSGQDAGLQDEQREVVRSHRQRALFGLLAVVFLNAGALGFVKAPLSLIVYGLGVVLMALAVRAAYRSRDIEMRLLRQQQSLSDVDAELISTGTLGEHSEYWRRQRRRSAQMTIVASITTAVVALCALVIIKVTGPTALAVAMLWCVVLMSSTLIVGAFWCVFALLKHRAAFITDFHAHRPGSSRSEGARAFASVKADFWPLFE